MQRTTWPTCAGPNGIDVVDVSNPAAPVDDGTFGTGQIVNGGYTVGRVDTIGGTQYLLVGTTVSGIVGGSARPSRSWSTRWPTP